MSASLAKDEVDILRGGFAFGTDDETMSTLLLAGRLVHPTTAILSSNLPELEIEEDCGGGAVRDVPRILQCVICWERPKRVLMRLVVFFVKNCFGENEKLHLFNNMIKIKIETIVVF